MLTDEEVIAVLVRYFKAEEAMRNHHCKVKHWCPHTDIVCDEARELDKQLTACWQEAGRIIKEHGL